jgi:hypothetical protein
MINVPVELVSTLAAVIPMKELYLKSLQIFSETHVWQHAHNLHEKWQQNCVALISNYTFRVNGESITYISITRIWWLNWMSRQKLIVETINLSQIEAICVK